jgi:dihydrofolate reductase
VAKLTYSAIASLDGYIEDEEGRFDWAEPDEEVHSFINELERQCGTYLLGRRLYEVMVAWETTGFGDEPRYIQDFAEIWRGADKIVYSSTLEEVSSARTRIERDFDLAAVRQMKTTAERTIGVGGAALASTVFRAGLIDELHLFVVPIVVGGGKQALPDDARVELELLDERRFTGGFVYLRYATR